MASGITLQHDGWSARGLIINGVAVPTAEDKQKEIEQAAILFTQEGKEQLIPGTSGDTNVSMQVIKLPLPGGEIHIHKAATTPYTPEEKKPLRVPKPPREPKLKRPHKSSKPKVEEDPIARAIRRAWRQPVF